MEDGGGGTGGAKVRVVRCPKCDKLLPEFPNLTVYRCGGCDTTLQAKAQISSSQGSPQSSDCEKTKMGKVAAPDSSSEAVAEREKIESLRGEDPILTRDKSARRDGASASRSEEGSGAGEDDGSHRRPSKAPAADICATAVDEQVKRSLEGGRQATATRYRDFSQNSARRRDAERGRVPSALFRRPLRPTPMESSHLAPYPDEGPSNYNFSHAYRYASAADSDAYAKQNAERVDHLEQDRAELLRKLDELRDQLKRSCEVAAPPKDRDPVGRPMPPSSSFDDRRRGAWYPEGSSSLNQASAHRSYFLAGQDASRLNLYPTMHPVNGIPGYRETLGRAPFHPTTHYPQRPLNNYMYSQIDPDPVVSYHHDGFYRHDGFYHQPACSCLHCYNNHCLPPAHIPHPLYNSNQRVPYLPNGNGFYPVEAPPMLGQQSYNQRVTNPSLHPDEPPVQPRPTFAKKDARSCRPIGGAAPFIACHSCLKLLELPKHISLMEKKRWKLRCGSCSHVMLFEFDGGLLVASASSLAFPEASDNNGNSVDGTKEDAQSHDFIGQPVSSYSGDYASAGYDFNSTDEKIVQPSPSPVSSQEMMEREYGLNFSGSEKMQGLSFSSTTSENLESPYSLIGQKDLPSSAELPLEDEATSRVASLPLREHFGYPPPVQVTNSSGKGSRSKRSEQERIVALDANFKQNSVKDVMVASEMDLSVDDYDNPSLSQDSWEGNKHEDEPRTNKGGESFFAGFIKKSFKDLSRSTENGRSKVSINGHPISDRIVKKAEKLAGPIHPGAYWYDYRAGFWGAMGHQCLGIIPPFIEEFNYTMPKNCAGGNADVLVNGRELHQKDLDLLVGRGLPAIEGRSYIIEISGKVWDEASGEELDSLGKLAPTVEKVKHGFGMRVPRAGA